MAIELRRNFQGLVTDMAETTAPESALYIADNVTLRKAGGLEMRQGWFAIEPMNNLYVQAVPYQGKSVYTTADGNVYLGNTPGNQWLLPLAGTMAPYASMAPLRPDTLRIKEARNNLYFVTAQGVNKLTSINQTTLVIAGNPITFEVNAYVENRTHTDPILQPNQRVAYRVVAVSRDENGVIVRSRPSGWSICNNTLSINVNPTVNVHADFVVTEITEVEVYRTRIFPVNVTPDDEMQLVRTIPRSAFTVTSGSYSFFFDDNVDDDQRGTTLYTSPSRGGMENAADRPPGAATLERFRGSLFFGNIQGPARRIVSFNLITRPTYTGTTTSGSATITGVSPNPTGVLKAGQVVNATNFPTTATLEVVGVTATTVTVNLNASASGAISFNVNDRIGYKIGSFEGWFLPWEPTIDPGAMIYPYYITPARPGYSYTLMLESLLRGGAPIQLRATNGASYNPPIAEWPTYDAGEPAEKLPNGLAWSEPDEPEHVPTKNFARVGDTGRAILALVATRDALYILKEDGVFRLTGTTTASFRIDPVDPTTLCVLPTSVQVIADRLVFLSSRGLVAVTGMDVAVISGPIQSELAPIIESIRKTEQSTGTYFMPGFIGQAACRDEANHEYHLALGSTTPIFGGHLLVWFAKVQGFTTYTFTAAPACLSDGATGQPLYLTATGRIEARFDPAGMLVRVAPHGFQTPVGQQKHWTHIVCGFHGTRYLTSITARVSSSAPYTPGAYIDEPFELPATDLPGGALLRTLVPRAHSRAWIVRVELRVDIFQSRTFMLELLGMEAIAAMPNRKDAHSGTGT